MRNLVVALLMLFPVVLLAEPPQDDGTSRQDVAQPMAFGAGGQIKMLYDRRQRPQSIYLNGKVHLVFNAGADPDGPPKSRTRPMAVTYDPPARITTMAR